MIQDSMAQKLQFFVGVKIPNIAPSELKINMFTLSIKEEKESPKNSFLRREEYKLLTGTTKIKYWQYFNKVSLFFICGLHLQQIFWKSFNSKIKRIKLPG
jgi:hypothetical protein